MTDDKIELFEYNGKLCAFYQKGKNGPCFLYGTGARPDQPADLQMKEAINKITAFQNEVFEEKGRTPDYSLFLYAAEDWDSDFSPWPCNMEDFRKKDPPRCFAGKGQETLNWLVNGVIPFLTGQKEVPADSLILTGYSLAGLFAAWGFYEAGCFTGLIAASASFWYEGWDRYMAEARAKRRSAAYLSLGGKEPSSGNPVMASIGKAYENQKKQMKADPNIANVFFEWNPGGHFADADRRIAKGIAWFLRNNLNENRKGK